MADCTCTDCDFMRKARDAMADFTERQKSFTQEEARAWLVKLGTHNPDGTLTPEYGGEA